MATTQDLNLSDLSGVSISRLAAYADDGEQWGGKKVNFAARPYLDAMLCMDFADPMGQHYGQDKADHVIRYFLSNASTWRGEGARAIKAELKRRVGMR